MKRKILFVLLILIALAVITIGCEEASNNTIIKSVVSPDGKFVAHVFIRDMGATTKASYQLSILQKGDKLSDVSGNIFITYSQFEVKWNSPKDLVIIAEKTSEIFKQETTYKDFRITYEMQ